MQDILKVYSVAICKGWARAFAFLAIYWIARAMFGEAMVKIEEKLNNFALGNFFGPVYAMFAMHPIIYIKDVAVLENIGILYFILFIVIAIIVLGVPPYIVAKIREWLFNR